MDDETRAKAQEKLALMRFEVSPIPLPPLLALPRTEYLISEQFVVSTAHCCSSILPVYSPCSCGLGFSAAGKARAVCEEMAGINGWFGSSLPVLVAFPPLFAQMRFEPPLPPLLPPSHVSLSHTHTHSRGLVIAPIVRPSLFIRLALPPLPSRLILRFHSFISSPSDFLLPLLSSPSRSPLGPRLSIQRNCPSLLDVSPAPPLLPPPLSLPVCTTHSCLTPARAHGVGRWGTPRGGQ